MNFGYVTVNGVNSNDIRIAGAIAEQFGDIGVE